MSLLTNLVTQIATNALQNKMGGHMPHAANPQDSMGGLGSILGGMLGGGQTGSTSSGVNLNNGFGLDDIIGMAMNQNQSSTAMPPAIWWNSTAPWLPVIPPWTVMPTA